jgi:hypothetical protein
LTHEDDHSGDAAASGPPYVWDPAVASPMLDDGAVEPGIENMESRTRESLPDSGFEVRDSLDWPLQSVEDSDERERAMKTIVALEQFLDAVHVPRTQPGA